MVAIHAVEVRVRMGMVVMGVGTVRVRVGVDVARVARAVGAPGSAPDLLAALGPDPGGLSAAAVRAGAGRKDRQAESDREGGGEQPAHAGPRQPAAHGFPFFF